MMTILKAGLIGAGLLVSLVVLVISSLLLLFFPEWVRWVAGGVATFGVVWFFVFGRFRRKAGLLINDGTVYDRWRGRSSGKGEFL